MTGITTTTVDDLHGRLTNAIVEATVATRELGLHLGVWDQMLAATGNDGVSAAMDEVAEEFLDDYEAALDAQQRIERDTARAGDAELSARLPEHDRIFGPVTNQIQTASATIVAGLVVLAGQRKLTIEYLHQLWDDAQPALAERGIDEFVGATAMPTNPDEFAAKLPQLEQLADSPEVAELTFDEIVELVS